VHPDSRMEGITSWLPRPAMGPWRVEGPATVTRATVGLLPVRTRIGRAGERVPGRLDPSEAQDQYCAWDAGSRLLERQLARTSRVGDRTLCRWSWSIRVVPCRRSSAARLYRGAERLAAGGRNGTPPRYRPDAPARRRTPTRGHRLRFSSRATTLAMPAPRAYLGHPDIARRTVPERRGDNGEA